MGLLRGSEFDVTSDLSQKIEINAINNIALVVKEAYSQKCYMLKCDYIALEYEGRYIPFWNLTLKDLSLSVTSFDERSLKHDPSVCYNG